MANPHFTAAQVAEALRESHGLHSVAAKRLGCSVPTIGNYVRRYQVVADAVAESRHAIVDMAEGQLLKALSKGYWPAVQYTLSTLGKDRGYAQTLDVRHRLEDIARQLAEETGEPFDAVLSEVTDLASERKKRRAA